MNCFVVSFSILLFAGLGLSQEKPVELPLKGNPPSASDYYNRGIAYRDRQNYKQAIDDFTKTIELDPNHLYAYTNRAHAFSMLMKYDEVIKDINKATELSSNDAWAYRIRGIAYKELRKFELAKTDFEKAIELGPGNATNYIYGSSLEFVGRI